MNVCTIVSRRQLARARVLTSTFHDHHPDIEFTVLLLDADPNATDALPGARLLGLQAIAGEEGRLLAAANPPRARPIALLPHLFGKLMQEHEEPVLYIGAGQRVLAPLDALRAMLAAHDVVLVTRLAGSRSFSSFGDWAHDVFTPELIGMRPSSNTADLLSRWPRYFTEYGDAGDRAVSAWFDSIPALAEDVAVLKDPAYAADPWNLAHLDVDAGEGDIAVEGKRVATFDFSALDVDDPLSLCTGEGGVGLSTVPALARLCASHAQELIAHGHEQGPASPPDAFTQLEGGVTLTAPMRTLLVDGLQAGELTLSPVSSEGKQAFLAYLNAPGERGAAAGLTRLHIAIWEAREDLKSAYPHIDGPDGPGYAGWLCENGAEQEGLTEALMPPSPDLVYRDANPMIHEDAPKWGVNVAGFFTAELGVGEAARLLMSALDARGVPALPVQGNLAPPSRQGATFSFAGPDEAAYPINIVCINGDGIPVFAREAGQSFFDDRYTIALWWWEVGEPPPEWRRAFDFVDEVWVGSQHIYDLIAPTSPVPVFRVTMPVLAPPVARRSRADLGLPKDDEFFFLFVHDYHSVAARKNPVGLIEAFTRAFAPGSGAKLVIKSINADRVPDEHDRVKLAAAGHPDITLIDAYVSAAEKNAMIAHCNCYVSLHRSEGFGLTVAEAMLLGKPVIATRYGGTLEFTNEHNSYLVECHPQLVGDRAGVYPRDAVWVEPDLDEAARLMRHVFTHGAEAAARGRVARAEVAEGHRPAVAGETMERRLRMIHQAMFDRGLRTLNPRHVPPSQPSERYPGQLESPPTIDWDAGRWGRLSVRGPISEWIRSRDEHQRSIDTEIFDRLATLDSKVRELGRALTEQQHARHAETLAVLRRLEAQLAELRGGDPGENGRVGDRSSGEAASEPKPDG